MRRGLPYTDGQNISRRTYLATLAGAAAATTAGCTGDDSPQLPEEFEYNLEKTQELQKRFIAERTEAAQILDQDSLETWATVLEQGDDQVPERMKIESEVETAAGTPYEELSFHSNYLDDPDHEHYPGTVVGTLAVIAHPVLAFYTHPDSPAKDVEAYQDAIDSMWFGIAGQDEQGIAMDLDPSVVDELEEIYEADGGDGFAARLGVSAAAIQHAEPYQV